MIRGLAVFLFAATLYGCAHGRLSRDGNAQEMAMAGLPVNWPRTFEKHGDVVVLYQPQIDEWTNYSKISFRAALTVTPKHKEPFYGVLNVKGDTFVNHDNRTVLITNLDANVRFANLPEKEAEKLEKMVREVLPKKHYLDISLDRVLACMHTNQDQAKPTYVNLNMDPPPILRSESPAILVIFAGQPQFKPVKDAGLMFAANTNWPMFLDTAASQYYLLNGESWLTAPDPLNGPWTAAQSLPASLYQLPNDANWEDVRKHIPGKPAAIVPKVYARTTPAELIVTNGPPEYTPLPGIGLLYVSNPALPLFLDQSDSSYYYLVAGRWFRASSLDGPWFAASMNLPAKFAQIPADSPVGYVLASVPNTQQAKDAVLLASVPHTATINIRTAKVEVTYEGAPQFVPIQGTVMQYAVNTPFDVIMVNGQYYCCHQGVWFVSPVPTGTWVVCTSVPTVIYTIPPENPLYNVTYVRLYDVSPTTVVYGYTSGYSGAYVAATGTLMFGAGMVAGAALATNNYYYHCSAAYVSYGCAATYHYGYGGFYAGAAYHGPYGGYGHYAAYNPATGAYSRGAYHYGPAGAAGVHEAYNPYTNTYRAHAGATNGYQSWGHSVATRGDDWAAAGHVSGENARAGWAETSTGRSAAAVQGPGGGTAVKTGSGDLYAGKDGNVWGKNSSGDWQHWNNGGWQSASHSASWSNPGFQERMNSDAWARGYGNQMESRWSGYRGGGGNWSSFHGGFRR